jgi:hypothetical protein
MSNKITVIVNGKVGSKLSGTAQFPGVFNQDSEGYYIEVGRLMNKTKTYLRKNVFYWKRISDPKKLASITGMAIGARYGSGGGVFGTLVGMGVGSLVARSQASGKLGLSLHVGLVQTDLYDYDVIAESETIEAMIRALPQEYEDKQDG